MRAPGIRSAIVFGKRGGRTEASSPAVTGVRPPVAPLEPERVHERGGVCREVGDAEGTVGRRGPSDAPVVEGREPVPVLEAGDLVDPARTLVREARDEEDVGAFSGLLDPQVDAVS